MVCKQVRIGKMKKTLLATSAAVLAAGSAAAVDVELYGQVNKGVFAADDGRNTETLVVDNARDSTRFGLKGAQALDNGLTASVLLEGELVDNASDALTQRSSTAAPFATTPSNSGNGTFTSRQARVGMSGGWGGLYVGKQSTAIDGVYVQDLAGASDVMGAAFNEIGGGLEFRNTIGGALAGPTRSVNAFSSVFDENRANSVRYDSPIFAGFQGRVSVAQGGDFDTSVFYDGGFGDFKIAGAAGYYWNNDDTSLRAPGTAGTVSTNTANADEAHGAASLSVAHSSGLAATVAYQRDTLSLQGAGVDDPSTWYGKVGYSWDAYEVAADYGKAKDYLKTGAANDDLRAMGLAAQYNLTDGVSLAALYRNFDAEVTGSDFEDINLYGVNMKVKF
jgi:predicted porin